MVNRAKAKGTSWESACVEHLRDNGVPHAERRALNGNKDRGDLSGIPAVVGEFKAEGSYDLAGWTAELLAEMANDGSDIGFVWAKRRGKTAPGAGYILTTPAVLLRLLREAGYIAGVGDVAA